MSKLTLLLATALVPVLASTAHAQAPKSALRQTTSSASPMLARTNQQAPAGREIAVQAPLARAILDGWQTKNPQRGDRLVRIVYWTPADREPAPMYRERLTKIMLDIQNFYGFEMNRNGFGPHTFKLQQDRADGLLQIYLARGDKPRSAYSSETGDEIRRDAMAELQKAGIDGDKETFVIFCNLADWDAPTRSVTGSSPYYASGTTRSGTAWQLDAPILSLDGLTDISDADKVHSGQYGFITLGHYDSIFIGGIAHELGHALSMPHNIERPDQAGWGKALMGSGNRTYGEELREDVLAKTESHGHGSFLPFADALRLASHPSFCGSVKGIDGVADAVISNVKLTAEGKKLVYTAHVSAEVPVYGVIGYFDPEGGQDYNARTATAIPDQNGNFRLECDALVAGTGGELRVVTLQANGAASSGAAGYGTSPRYAYGVNADGTPDLSLWNTSQQLSPLITAIKANDREAAQAALTALEIGKAPANVLEIARVQIAAFDTAPKPVPAQAAGEALFLSEAQPTQAKVGWLAPAYNRLPMSQDDNSNPLFQAGGHYFARGIYAHAPAQHIYDLGGKWKRFTGSVGIEQGNSGSVSFTIRADGKELWKSPVLHEGELATFDVAVPDVQTLELQVDDGGNGNSSDWGVWLDPTLKR